jgi:hypothetical protein
MNVNARFEIQSEPDEQKSFLLFGQSCFVDVSLVESGLLLALVPQIDKIIECGLVIDLEFAYVVHLFKFIRIFFGQIFEVEGNKKHVTTQDILSITLIPNLLLF